MQQASSQALVSLSPKSSRHSPLSRQFAPAVVLSFLLSFLGWGLLWSAEAVADSASGVSAASANIPTVPASGVPTVTPNDNGSWKGDTIVIHTDVKDIKAASDPLKKYFAPADSMLHVSTDGIDQKPSSQNLTVKFDRVGDCKPDSPCAPNPRKPADQEQVDLYSAYVMDKAAVEAIDHSRRGWTFGALIVPFKYQTHDKSFSGSTSIGPYLGYRIANDSTVSFKLLQGTSTTFVLSAGWVSNIAVATAPGVTPAGTVNSSGLSLATGFIFAVDKGTGIRVGVLAGQDRLGSNSTAPYPYEGKTWVSLAVGYKFF